MTWLPISLAPRDDDDWFDPDEDSGPLEDAEMSCGERPEGGCDLAGTEWCDWSCPFHDEVFSAKTPPPDALKDGER